METPLQRNYIFMWSLTINKQFYIRRPDLGLIHHVETSVEGWKDDVTLTLRTNRDLQDDLATPPGCLCFLTSNVTKSVAGPFLQRCVFNKYSMVIKAKVILVGSELKWTGCHTAICPQDGARAMFTSAWRPSWVITAARRRSNYKMPA